MKFIGKYDYNEDIYQYFGNQNSQLLRALSGITFPDERYEVTRKNSYACSIEYVYSGEGVIQENTNIYKVSAGDFFILHPGTYHHYYTNPKNPWKKIFITLEGDTTFPMALLKLYKIDNITHFPNINTPINLEKIYDAVKSDSSDISLRLEQMVSHLIIELAHISKSPSSSILALEAKKFIDKRLYTRITVEEVSNEFHVSTSYFTRIFKKAIGISPVTYIQEAKLNIAKTMLSTTHIPIHIIAEKLAFSNAGHMTNKFTASVGMSPSEYREKHMPQSPEL